MILGITGPKLSGKGTSADYLRSKHGAVIYSMSGILFDIANRLHLPTTRENLIKIATGLRSQFGEDILGQVLKQDLLAAGDALAVIDGIRMPSEFELFSELPGFQLLYIDAPVKERYERSLKRGEKEGETEMTFEQFQAEESAVTEQGIAGLKERASKVITNDSTIAELNSLLESIIKQS